MAMQLYTLPLHIYFRVLKYGFTHYTSFNTTPVYNKPQYEDFKNRMIIIITFKFGWISILRFIFNHPMHLRRRKDGLKTFVV
jgi:hypothetical protein